MNQEKIGKFIAKLRKQKGKLYKEKSRMERTKGILVEKETRI